MKINLIISYTYYDQLYLFINSLFVIGSSKSLILLDMIHLFYIYFIKIWYFLILHSFSFPLLPGFFWSKVFSSLMVLNNNLSISLFN